MAYYPSTGPNPEKFFGSFFQKRTTFLLRKVSKRFFLKKEAKTFYPSGPAVSSKPGGGNRTLKQALAALGLVMLVQPALAQTAPGQCVQTMITAIGHRLEDGLTKRAIPGSGSTVTFSNRVGLVGYEELPQIARARVGDRAMLCLVALPTGCPAGDNRGRTYTATDLRTHESWTLSDSEHSCGGA